MSKETENMGKDQDQAEDVFSHSREDVWKAEREHLRHAAEKLAHEIHDAWESLRRLSR